MHSWFYLTAVNNMEHVSNNNYFKRIYNETHFSCSYRQPCLKTEQTTPFCNQLWLRYRFSWNNFKKSKIKKSNQIKNLKIEILVYLEKQNLKTRKKINQLQNIWWKRPKLNPRQFFTRLNQDRAVGAGERISGRNKDTEGSARAVEARIAHRRTIGSKFPENCLKWTNL
jgi:hypothetical protein